MFQGEAKRIGAVSSPNSYFGSPQSTEENQDPMPIKSLSCAICDPDLITRTI